MHKLWLLIQTIIQVKKFGLVLWIDEHSINKYHLNYKNNKQEPIIPDSFLKRVWYTSSKISTQNQKILDL